MMTRLPAQVRGRLRVQLKVGEQNANLRDACGIFTAIRVNHRQTKRFQIQDSRSRLLGRHAVSGAQVGINSVELRLQH